MSWKINTKGDTINDGARKLKVGRHAYKITGARSVLDKQDGKGRRQQILFELQLVDDPSYTCRVYLSVMAEDETPREIAVKTFRAIAVAAGINGVIGPDRLPSFVGKIIVIDARETAGKGDNKGKSYVNISTVDAFDAADDDDEEDDDDDEEDDDDDEEGKSSKTSSKKGSVTSSSGNDDDDDDDDDEDSDEDEDEDDPPPVVEDKRGKPVPKPAPKPAAKSGKAKLPWE